MATEGGGIRRNWEEGNKRMECSDKMAVRRHCFRYGDWNRGRGNWRMDSLVERLDL